MVPRAPVLGSPLWELFLSLWVKAGCFTFAHVTLAPALTSLILGLGA